MPCAARRLHMQSDVAAMPVAARSRASGGTPRMRAPRRVNYFRAATARAMPRRMCTSSLLSSRAVEQLVQARHQLAPARPGRESRSSTSVCCQCAEQALHLGRAGQFARLRARAHREAAERLPPVVGDQLHRLREVERAVGGVGRDAEAGVAAVDVVVAQAEALGAEHEGDPLPAAGQVAGSARAARASAGRSRAASSPWRRRR